MVNQNFPGNPFSEGKRGSSLELEALVNAVHLLAFEQRTANIQRQAAVVVNGPDFTDRSEDEYALWEGLQKEVGARLGLQVP